MDDKELDRIIDNDREWRKHLVKEVAGIRTEQTEIKVEMAKMKVWIWIGRAAFVAAWGGIYGWIRGQLGGH